MAIDTINLFARDGQSIPGFVPAASFDHLVGAKQERLRHQNAYGPRCAEIDYERELRRLLNRHVGRAFPSHNLMHESGGAAEQEVRVSLPPVIVAADPPLLGKQKNPAWSK